MEQFIFIEDLTIAINPTHITLRQMLKEHGDLRFMFDRGTNDWYIWDAYRFTHDQILSILKRDYYYPLKHIYKEDDFSHGFKGFIAKPWDVDIDLLEHILKAFEEGDRMTFKTLLKQYTRCYKVIRESYSLELHKDAVDILNKFKVTLK